MCLCVSISYSVRFRLCVCVGVFFCMGLYTCGRSFLFSLFSVFCEFFFCISHVLSNFRKFISVQGNWYIAMILFSSSYTRRVLSLLFTNLFISTPDPDNFFSKIFFSLFLLVFNSRSNHNLSFPLVVFFLVIFSMVFIHSSSNNAFNALESV